jgi:hypothetical protein
VIFDVNDFDETDPGPWEWVVKRLAASLHVVAREHGFARRDREHVVTTAVRVYREYVHQYAEMRTLDVWYDRTTTDDLVEHFPKRYRAQAQRDLTRALRKDHLRAVTKLTTDAGGRPRFVEDPPIVVHRPASVTRDGGSSSASASPRPRATSSSAGARHQRPPLLRAPLWDVTGQGDLTRMELGKLTHYGALCARALARAHARTGDAPAVAGYLGTGPVFDEAVARFAAVDAPHNLRDHGALVEAIAAGQVPSRSRS